jgi:hypothetical protein
MRSRARGCGALGAAAAALALACAEPTDTPAGPAEPPARDRTPTALIDGAPRRPRSIAVMQFDLGRGPPDVGAVTRTFSTASSSVRMLYREISYGMQDLVVEVLGPYTLPVAACLTQACCGPESDRGGNGAAVAEIIAALPRIYDHYFWMYGDTSTASGCAAWGDTGSPAAPARYGSLTQLQITPVAQEIGHNLGMEHEHTLACGGSSSWADDPSTCTSIEYGSNLSFMGIGRGHPSGFHKAHQGWLWGCNVVRTGGAGRFTLLPLGRPCGGAQLLQIPAPKARNAPRQTVAFYYAELRTLSGMDTSRMPTVLLYAGPEITPSDRFADHTFLIDPRLTAAGQAFHDPGGGLSITLEAIDSQSATLIVSGTEKGVPTCRDGSAFAAPGPGPAACSEGLGGAGGARDTGGATGAGGNGAGGAGGAADAAPEPATGGSGGAPVPVATRRGAVDPRHRRSPAAPDSGGGCTLAASPPAAGPAAASAVMLALAASALARRRWYHRRRGVDEGQPRQGGAGVRNDCNGRSPTSRPSSNLDGTHPPARGLPRGSPVGLAQGGFSTQLAAIEKGGDRRHRLLVDVGLSPPGRGERALGERQRMVAPLHHVERARRAHAPAHLLQAVDGAEPVARPLHEQDRDRQRHQDLVAHGAALADERVAEADERRRRRDPCGRDLDGQVAADAAPHALARQHHRSGVRGAGGVEGGAVRGHQRLVAIRRAPPRELVRVIEAADAPQPPQAPPPSLHPRRR